MKTKQSRLKLWPNLLLLLLVAVVALTTVACTLVNPVDVEPDLPPDPPGPDMNDPYLLLVNKWNPMPEDWAPEMKKVQGNFVMEVRAADACIAMIQAAAEEGISLLIVSSYRPYETQARLFNNKVQEFVNQGYSRDAAEERAATIVARPGTSEHNTGLAVDIVTPSYQRLNRGFADTEAAKWMAANAHKFGFILRYPDDKQEITGVIFEPWHFRYVGIEHATAMFESGLVLEEYLEGR